MFDTRGNLWYDNLKVRWSGANYAFTDGQWLSATRFQAGYNFDANVIPGFYALQIGNAIGSDGMPAYASTSASFQVDFGAGVTLDPPAPPQVTALTSGNISNLSATWQNSSPNVDQYRYAIGTAPGTRNVVGWTYLAGTSITRNDLNLVQGQSYYVTVQVRNASGLWSANGVSNPVIAGIALPTAPTVTAQVGGSTTISATWTTTSQHVDQYRFAIGTTPGGRDVLDWVVTTGTSMVRNDLALVPGQAYYVTVQVHNASGQWSGDGVSNPVVAGTPPAQLRKIFLPLVRR